MATGALDANGIWQYGEDDSETTFSGLLNKLGDSVSDKFTGGLPVASGGTGATTAAGARASLGVGLVPISPSSVSVASGTGSANALGLISFSGASAVTLENVFSSAYENYRVIWRMDNCTNAGAAFLRLRTTSGDSTTTYSQGGAVERANGTRTTANSTSYWAATFFEAGSPAFFGGDIIRPNIATFTNYAVQGLGREAAQYASITVAGMHNTAASYTGLTIALSAGTHNGTIQVFGYND